MTNLAVICRQMGQVGEAERWYRAAVEDYPGFIPGWLCLAEMLGGQGNQDEVEAIAKQLEWLGCRNHAQTVRARYGPRT
jgi:hypothetical protein